ncbi:hypothetical protein [Roseomonas sp. WA12]
MNRAPRPTDPRERSRVAYSVSRLADPRHSWAIRAAASLRYRARRKGLPATIDAAFLERNLPVVCPVLGIPLQIHAGVGQGCRPDSPTVDRIDNRRGYTPDNVVVVSARANCIKGNRTREEILARARTEALFPQDADLVALFYARLLHRSADHI